MPKEADASQTVNFRSLLLNKCQQEFEKDKVEELDIAERQKLIDDATSVSLVTDHSHRWHSGATGKAFGLAISRSLVQILLEATLRNNLRQVVYTYLPLSPSSITWYRPKGGDALRLGR